MKYNNYLKEIFSVPSLLFRIYLEVQRIDVRGAFFVWTEILFFKKFLFINGCRCFK